MLGEYVKNATLNFVRKIEKKLPLTLMILADSPGAWLVDITVSAERCVTALTCATHIHGPPNKVDGTLRMQSRTMSQ